MTLPLIFDMRQDGKLAETLVHAVKGKIGKMCHRYFPDGESYIRLESEVKDRDVIFTANLSQPDAKIIPLLLAAKTASSLGAKTLGLVTPYLPYMRQDIAFQPGEAVSARYFGQLLSSAFDWMVTVDPHLHRVQTLKSIYQLNPITVSSMPAIIGWIKNYTFKPLLVGPDSESRQWVSVVAKALNAPYLVARKKRHGDHSVEIDMPDLSKFQDYTPIIIDDIISTGTTFVKTVDALRPYGLARPICLTVHALMPEGVESKLVDAGAAQIISTNCVPHKSNKIDINDLIGDAVVQYLKTPPAASLHRSV